MKQKNTISNFFLIQGESFDKECMGMYGINAKENVRKKEENN